MPIAVTVVGSDDRELLHEVARARVPRHARRPRRPGDAPSTGFEGARRVRVRHPRSVAPAAGDRPGRSASSPAPASSSSRARSIPTEMLEAMRMGVNEWVAEPLTLDGARRRHPPRRAGRSRKPPAGQTFAVMGAKGGVGSTTVAVNLATALHEGVGRADAGDGPAPRARRCLGVLRRRAALLGARRAREHPSPRRDLFQGPGHARPRPARTCWPRPIAR